MIHEYDPWFNYRATKFLSWSGPYEFLNWMDDRSWYPLGRIVGGTAYPGMMGTSYMFHKILNMLHFTIQVRNMCVFISPIFAAATAIASYLLTYEVVSFLVPSRVGYAQNEHRASGFRFCGFGSVLHFSLRRGQLRLRGHVHLRHALHVLLVGEGGHRALPSCVVGEHGLAPHLGVLRAQLLLHGVVVGRLRLHH